jgi:hypothetical protein
VNTAKPSRRRIAAILLHDLKYGIALAGGLALAMFVSHTGFTAQLTGAASSALIPPLMLPYGAGWSGGGGRGNGADVPAEDFMPADFLNGAEHIEAALVRGVPPDKVRAYLQTRVAGQYIPPASGLGPISDDPKHPYFSNSSQRAGVGRGSTVRVADLENAAAKNLKPWALAALKKQNELALAGRNTQPRMARCWQVGIPAFDEVRHPLYVIQTPEEIVMYAGQYVRHIYLNVPHSKDLKPSWYGESVGHYEGDTLVVDTIGQNDKTLLDMYRTPHTDQIHVVERYRVINSGRGLDTTFTVTDPGTFHKPWSARRPRYVVADYPLAEQDRICAAGNEDVFNTGLEPLQKAAQRDY